MRNSTLVLLCALALGGGLSSVNASVALWQIGQPDGSGAEFAAAPGHYDRFESDAFYVVGRSDSKRDWFYAQPGPANGWGGSQPHTFAVVFGVKAPPVQGECKLILKLLDTHRESPPELKISLNGVERKLQTEAGGSTDSIYGQLQKAKLQTIGFEFPASTLKSGVNELTITSVAGSWMIYDWVSFEAPEGTELAESSGTILSGVSAPPVLVGSDPNLKQAIKVALKHLGADTSAVLRAGGAATNFVLRSPMQSVELAVPAVEKETPLAVSLEVGGQQIASRTVSLKPVRKWTIYLLPHSHVDIGYTHVQTEVEHAQWRYIEMGIEAARKSANYPLDARFKWNTEVLWAVDSYLRQATPEKQQQFFEAVKAGWVGLDGLYGNELTGLCRPEELLRLVGLAAKLSARSGVSIESAMITDVPGYTWGIVPAFAQSGIKYFSVGPNGGDRIGRTISAWGDKPFWWIGPNGKDKVLVWVTGTGYYQVFRSPENLMGYLGNLQAKDYPYDMVHVRHCLGDNGAPDVDFADKVKAWNETHAYPHLVIATTAEMFHAFEQRYGSQLPVAKGDFTPYWEDGAASSARETALNRASADRLTQAETLFALLQPNRYPAEEFYQAWRNVVLYDEHTWGAHNSISEPDAPFVKSQWAIKQAFALEADKQSRQLLKQALASPAPGKVEAVDVYNTTSWPRTDLVILPAEIDPTGDVVKGPDGKQVPSQRLSTGELAFLAKAVTPLGASRYAFSAGTPQPQGKALAEGCKVSNARLQVQIDQQSGAIASLRMAGSSVEWVDAKSGTAVNDYFYLPGSKLTDLQRNGPVKITTKERGPLVASLLIEGEAPGCRKLTREVRVIADLDRVDLLNTVDKLPVRAKEGVHFGFGFNVPHSTVRMDVPWAVVRAELDQIPGACKNWFTVQRWIDISNDRYGVACATPDAPLFEVGGITANLLGGQSNPEAWRDLVEETDTIYSWAMNNHWHTNYRAEQEGPTLFRYSLWPHQAFQTDETARFGVSCSQPLIVVPAGSGRPSEPLLRVEPAGVLVTAFRPSEDGRAWIIHLFGASGEACSATLHWRQPVPATLRLSDVGEKAGEIITGPVPVPGYGLVILRAERQ
ncbi:MAG: polysaccharide lyase family protein [Verrucomicrobia bacterium]|nr:polysaccharide lyase family protein [Verrucomicrobiota bacterium]